MDSNLKNKDLIIESIQNSVSLCLADKFSDPSDLGRLFSICFLSGTVAASLANHQNRIN